MSSYPHAYRFTTTEGLAAYRDAVNRGHDQYNARAIGVAVEQPVLSRRAMEQWDDECAGIEREALPLDASDELTGYRLRREIEQ